MKVKLEILSNLNLKKPNKKNIEEAIFQGFLNEIGKQALKDVKATFRTGVDITGENDFEPLNKKYKKSKFKNKNKILVLMGDLRKSIKLQRNKEKMRISVGSTLDEKYPEFHLTGEGDNPQRKWIYTQDEVDTIFESTKMLKPAKERGEKNFKERFTKLLKGRFRSLGMRELDLNG